MIDQHQPHSEIAGTQPRHVQVLQLAVGHAVDRNARVRDRIDQNERALVERDRTGEAVASGKIEHPLQAIMDGGPCTWFLTPAKSVLPSPS